MSVVEKKPESLEEEIDALRKQGLSDDEVVREIFKKDMEAPVSEICELTGMEKLKVGRIKGQVSRWRKRHEEKKAGTKETTEEEPPEGIYKGETEYNKILHEALVGHPDIREKHIQEIMSWARMSGGLHPTQVAYLLSSMRGIDPKTANMVAQKYSLALINAQREAATQQALLPGLMSPTMKHSSFNFQLSNFHLQQCQELHLRSHSNSHSNPHKDSIVLTKYAKCRKIG